MLWSFTIYRGVVLVEHFDQLEAAGNKEVWNVTPIQLIRWNIVNQSKTFMEKNLFKYGGIHGIAGYSRVLSGPSHQTRTSGHVGMLPHVKIVVLSCCLRSIAALMECIVKGHCCHHTTPKHIAASIQYHIFACFLPALHWYCSIDSIAVSLFFNPNYSETIKLLYCSSDSVWLLWTCDTVALGWVRKKS